MWGPTKRTVAYTQLSIIFISWLLYHRFPCSRVMSVDVAPVSKAQLKNREEKFAADFQQLVEKRSKPFKTRNVHYGIGQGGAQYKLPTCL